MHYTNFSFVLIFWIFFVGIKDAFTRFKNRSSNATPSWPDQLTWIVTNNLTTSSSMTTNLLKEKLQSFTATNSQNIKDDENEYSKIAFLQYTSGSTSEPKGVMITHLNLSHNLTIITRELKADESTKVVSWLPQYHDMGLIGSYLGIIYCGGSGYYMSPLTFLQRPILWMEAISKYKGTHIQAPNFAYRLTARKFRKDALQELLDLSSLVHMINAAEPIDKASLDYFCHVFEPFGLNPKTMFPTYGLAEHTVFVCSGGRQILKVKKQELETERTVILIHKNNDENLDENLDENRISTIVGCGYPSNQNIDVRIVDDQSMMEVGENQVGEIWVHSLSKAGGYFQKERESQETFYAKLSNTNDDKTYLRTGDLGFIYEKELFICGRSKDLIIVGGRNHYPQDIESSAEEVSSNIRPGCTAAFSVNPIDKGDEKVALLLELRETPKAKVSEAKI